MTRPGFSVSFCVAFRGALIRVVEREDGSQGGNIECERTGSEEGPVRLDYIAKCQSFPSIHLQSVGRQGGAGGDARKGALNFLKGATPNQDMMGGVDGGTGWKEMGYRVVVVVEVVGGGLKSSRRAFFADRQALDGASGVVHNSEPS